MSAMAMKARGGSAKERSVFVGNIPYDVTEDQLREIFSEVGSVVNFRLVTDRESGKPKGYGFCEYADGATALSAMRNLNGYEVSGRNLRVDFADGGDRAPGGGAGGGGGGGGGMHGGGGMGMGMGGGGDHKSSSNAVSGEALIKAIESAIGKFGPVKLYDMLVNLKEHARQKPEHTKSILTANPALTHAIVQCFKTLNIPILSPNETHSGLLSAPLLPPPSSMARPPPPHQGGMLPPPQRSPMHAMAPPGGGGGILGMAPPGVGGAPLLSAPPLPAKPGSRWSSRPGPLAAAATPSMPLHMAPPGGGMLPPPQQQLPVQHQQQQQQPPPLMPTPPSAAAPAAATAAQRSRDPRRARDPRLAKRAGSELEQTDDKRVKTDDGSFRGTGSAANTSEYDEIAALARDMTPEKLNMLPPEERQLLMAYMQQHGIKIEYPH